jgi:hypothetical protein
MTRKGTLEQSDASIDGAAANNIPGVEGAAPSALRGGAPPESAQPFARRRRRLTSKEIGAVLLSKVDTGARTQADVEEWIKEEVGGDSENAAESESGAKAKSKAKMEGLTELPDETQRAPKLPKSKRSQEDYPATEADIFAGEGEDDDADFSDEKPLAPKLTDKLPRAKYIRFRPGSENRALIFALKLDEEDQRPGELKSYIVSKEMRDYFMHQLDYPVTKTHVFDVATLQGDQFLFMTSLASELDGNTWNSSKREMIAEGTKGWIIVRTDMKAKRYRWRTRKAHLSSVEVNWPIESIKSRIVKAIEGPRYISSKNHPIARRLAGEIDEDTES